MTEGPEAHPLEPFNLETMSGVHPGSRTRVYQQVRLRSREGDAVRWAQIRWHEAPRRCTVHLQISTSSNRWAETPLCVVDDPQEAGLQAALVARLEEAGWRLLTCGTCGHWHPAPGQDHPDGLPMGLCGWQGEHPVAEPVPAGFRRQSLLALDCGHWCPTADGRPPDVLPEEPPAPASAREPLESSPGGWWQRLRARWRRSRPEDVGRTSSWLERLAERSGVGAGTEPCFACQGRLANWGALTLATPEGDKRTVSVWRCRLCGTWYLNDWVDRWERLDSLETEERYFRLAPMEALEVLARIHRVPGGEHPQGREQRTQERAWVDGFLAQRTPLSHQRRQGR